jgi:dTDP-4-amino-4,6-dideoxygalactose transaminase
VSARVPFIDLGPSHRPLERRILAAVRSAFRRNAFVLGGEVTRLEEAFARLCGATHGVGVASGTAALSLTVRALGAGPGDEVLTSAFSFFSSASAIAETGAKPAFVDVEPDTLNIDASRLERSRTRRTRGVLPVHLFGQPADMDAVLSFSRARRLWVVEDACQSHGARWRGRAVGGWGTAGCFSFYPTKNLGGLGDGGLVVTSDGGLAARLRSLRNCGRRDQPYVHEELGYVERLDNLQAAALLVKLERLSSWNAERVRLARVYRDELVGCPARPLAEREGAESVCHVFTVRAPRRDALAERLARNGVGTAVFYRVPLHLQPAFKGLGYRRGDFPESERAAAEVLALPLFPGLSRAAAARVARLVRRFYEGGRPS